MDQTSIVYCAKAGKVGAASPIRISVSTLPATAPDKHPATLSATYLLCAAEYALCDKVGLPRGGPPVVSGGIP